MTIGQSEQKYEIQKTHMGWGRGGAWVASDEPKSTSFFMHLKNYDSLMSKLLKNIFQPRSLN